MVKSKNGIVLSMCSCFSFFWGRGKGGGEWAAGLGSKCVSAILKQKL